MKILSVEISNVKGIKHHIFELDLVPNKPNLLVAPNGFGKSSFTTAFQSLNNKRIELDDKDRYLNSDAHKPEIILAFEDNGNTIKLIANEFNNDIQNVFDVFVINSQLTSKATLLKFGGKSIVKSSMEIEPIILVNTIPQQIKFNYNHSTAKKSFGQAGKILPDIGKIILSGYVLLKINKDIDFGKFQQIKLSKSIDLIFDEIKSQTGTVDSIIKWIKDYKIEDLRKIEELNKLTDLIGKHNIAGIENEVDCFLAAYELIDLTKTMGGDFKKASNFIYYLDKKHEYTEMIQSVNSTRINIKPKEDKKKNSLVVEWPKAHEISNGQRDILSFMALLLKARSAFRKRDCILIIDEIFDYLDDGNLISFQYFITQMIERMKSQGRNFFPILLTHLDPMFFSHFCFNRHKIKVVYLKDAEVKTNPNLIKIIRNREEPSIEALADKHHFHFNPSHVDLSAEFDGLGLLKQWGESERFHQHIKGQIDKYLNDETYDPFAVCICLRVKIESLLHNDIIDATMQTEFLNLHGTKKKLDYCEQIGLDVPEYFYLLGIIYNDNLHLQHDPNVSNPLAIKLENLTIKKMVRDVFEN